jgi:hypothetical protein
MCLSAGAHLRWHANPIEAAQWWLSQFGQEAYSRLRQGMQKPFKIDRTATLLWLQQELKRYQRAA